MSALPPLNRRRLLLGLAAASSTGAAIAVAGATPVAASENPNLLRLGDDLPAIEASFLAAREAKFDAYRLAMADWPIAPDLLRRNSPSRYQLEQDVAGAGIKRGETVWSLWSLEEAQAAARHATRREKARYEELQRVAEAYYGRTAELTQEYGYERTQAVEVATRDALVAHVASIMSEAPTTMAGVVIHAQALASFGKIEPLYRFCVQQSWPWSATFAESVLRIAGEAPTNQA